VATKIYGGEVPLGVLDVEHKGQAKMVGLLVRLRVLTEHGIDRVAFLHVHTTTQHHFRLNCPSPVDKVVLEWLRDRDIGVVLAYEQDTETLRAAYVEAIIAAPAAESDGRVRHYLEEGEWRAQKGVTERRVGTGRQYALGGRVLFDVPYLRRHYVMGKG